MRRISEWKLAQKLQAHKKAGLVCGVAVGVVLCLVIIAAVVKVFWLKKKFSCVDYDMDVFESDFEEPCDCDDNGCSFTSEKDFV